MYLRSKEETPSEDEMKFKVIEKLTEEFKERYGEVNTLDGIKVYLRDGWVLIRASNTSPLLRLTVEADTEGRVKEVVNSFKKETMRVIDSIRG